MRPISASFMACLLVGLASPGPASAARILFLSDSTTDPSIPDVLIAAGHDVTVITDDFASGNLQLAARHAEFQAVYWSAAGGGSGDVHSATGLFESLSAYVAAGGMVFVTGYDSIASPEDPPLIAFIGATSSSDGGSASGPVIGDINVLTTGVVDIRGMMPTDGYGDQDTAIGLMGDTVMVVPSGTGALWTLRSLGAGRIAYVSNGASGGGTEPSWSDPASAYYAALLNFAAAADGRPLMDAGVPDLDAGVSDGGVSDGGGSDAGGVDSGGTVTDGAAGTDAGALARRSRRRSGCAAAGGSSPGAAGLLFSAILLILAVRRSRRP